MKIFTAAMLQAAVIQLRSKRSPESITDPLQIEPSMDVAALNAYLNSTLSTATEYALYYGSARIRDGMQEVVDRHGLNAEDVIVVDYLDMQEQCEDFSIPCEDVVTKLCLHGGCVYARLYDGRLIELESGGQKRAGLGCVAGGERLVCAEGSAVVNAETGGMIAEFPACEVVFLESRGPVIAVGLSKNRIVLLRDGEAEEIPTEDFYRCPRLTDDALYWIESLDVVVRYDFAAKKKSSFYTRNTVVSIAIGKDAVYGATSNGTVLAIRDKETDAHDVSVRVANDIILSGDAVILVAQHSIVSLDINTLAEKTCFFLDEQINSVVVAGDRLLAANGPRVSGFFLSRLL